MVKQRSATRLVFGWLSLRRTVMVMLLLLTGHLSSSGQGLPNLLLHDRELRSEYGSYVGNQRLAIAYHKGLLLVPGRVNDRAGYFLLDTGAPFLLINEVVVDELCTSAVEMIPINSPTKPIVVTPPTKPKNVGKNGRVVLTRLCERFRAQARPENHGITAG